MKKLLAMLLALSLLALCACTSITTTKAPETTTESTSEETNQTEQTDTEEPADAAEGTDETAAEPDDRVKPLPDAIDVTALTDAMVAASFDESAIEEADGKTYLTLQVYDYDRYDMVDISKLAEGSVIVAGGKDMTVSSVERDGALVLINGGLTRGGMTLTTQDDGVYYELGVNDVKCYQEKGEVTLPLSASFTLTDDSDPDHPNQTYGAEKLSELVSSGFTANNTLVTIENGEITAITRTVAP